MKQYILRLLAVLTCCLLLTVFGACKKEEDPCKNGHSYATAWTFDETEHWRVATCGHQKEMTDKGVHSFDESNRCTVCGYVLTPARGLIYEPNEENTAYIVTGTDKVDQPVVLVAQTYEGLPVTGIGDNAFCNCREVKTVVLPQGITEIGESAFYDCTELAVIRMPESVTKIGNLAFYGCVGLSDISLPSALTYLGEGAFYGCTSLKTISIPHGITKIASSLFYGCSGMTNVIIPAEIREIGDRAFYNCSALVGITFSEGVIAIGDFAFGNCTRMSGVTIPASVESIGVSAFRYCTNLTSISFLNDEGWNVVRHTVKPESAPPTGVEMDVSDEALNVRKLTDEYAEYCWKRERKTPSE